MKSIITLLFFLPVIVFAQKKTYTISELVPIDSTSGDVVYQGVVQVEGATAADLYSRAKTFYLKTFNNSNAVIQADEPGKRVGGKGYIMLKQKESGLFSQGEYKVTMDIQVKDGRYRYEFSQFAIHTSSMYGDVPIMKAYSMNSKGFNERQAEKIRYWNNSVLAFVAELNSYMIGKSSATKDF